MKKRKRNVSRSLILAGVFGGLFWLVWQKVRLHVIISLSPLQALVIFGVIGLVLFLLVDHLLNRGN